MAWKSLEFPVLTAALVWMVTALLLAYSPVNLQRRFMHAYILPLALLATTGLKDAVSPWVDRHMPSWIGHRKRLLTILLIIFISMTSLLLGIGNGIYVWRRPIALFDPVELVQAVDWLASHASSDDIVVSTEQTGQLIAARTGLGVYLGHPIETLDYTNKTTQVAALLSGGNRGDWLDDSGVSWVFCGPIHLKNVCNINPEAPLVPVYDENGVEIFQVVH